jgi:hypothetical protein
MTVKGLLCFFNAQLEKTGEVEIFALSAPFNLVEWREIFILLFNIVWLEPGFYCLRSKLARLLEWYESKQS